MSVPLLHRKCNPYSYMFLILSLRSVPICLCITYDTHSSEALQALNVTIPDQPMSWHRTEPFLKIPVPTAQ